MGGSTLNDLHMTLEELTRSVKSLVDMYCRTFHTEFRFESTSLQRGELKARTTTTTAAAAAAASSLGSLPEGRFCAPLSPQCS